MSHITFERVSFTGRVVRHFYHSSFSQCNAEFQFGKSYVLLSIFPEDAFAISWIVAGALKHQGIIRKDGRVYSRRERFRDAWRVRSSHHDIRRFGLIDRTVQGYIRYAQKHSRLQQVPTESEIKDLFHLTEARYTRPMNHLSGEAWRASCAVAYVLGKRIFCFPIMLRAIIEQYDEIWFAEMISLLTATGALVIVPMQYTYPVRSGFCDYQLELGSLMQYETMK
jgi:hypothetical protein